jgi:hypothetical protein
LTPGTGAEPDQPGGAECDFYWMWDWLDPPELHEVGKLKFWVYNLSPAALAGDQWILTIRDKAGTWFAVTGGGGGGDGGIYARVETADCAAGSFTLREIEPLAAGGWQDKAGGIGDPTPVTAYHLAKGLGPFAGGGPLVQVGTRVRAWPGEGSDWRFGGPAGWTGTEEYVADWQCVGDPPVPQKTTRFRVLWNGLQIRDSCISTPPSSICSPCT